jgi:TPR repeat protein
VKRLILVLSLIASACSKKPVDDGTVEAAQAKAYLAWGPSGFSLEKAAAAYEAGCKKGNQAACAALAVQVQDGRGVPRDLARAIDLYEKACAAGVGVGCMNRAFMFMGGVVDDPDDHRGKPWFEMAEPALKKQCEGGDLQWCTNLGVLHEDGFIGAGKDPAAAAAVYKKACDQQMGEWCVNLALLEVDGRGVPADQAGGKARLEKTCAAKIPLGCAALGRMLIDNGEGQRGLELLDHACDDGEVQACAGMGGFLGLGDKVPRDVKRANAAEERACLLGSSSGCLLSGAGLREEGKDAEALPWFQRGCDIGDGEACLEVVNALLKSGSTDVTRAQALVTDACRMGELMACDILYGAGKPLPIYGERKAKFLSARERRTP